MKAPAVISAVSAALGVAVLAWSPVAAPPQSQRLDAVGTREVLPDDFAVIDAVLARRAPGWGLTLRRQIAVAISEEAQRAGFDPLLILALIDVESDFQDDAVSPVGARGLMQIRPTTLYWFAEKQGFRLSRDELARDPSLNVRLGVRYLKAMHLQFRELELALMAYNMGPNKLKAQTLAGDLERFRGYPAAVKREYLTLRDGRLGGGWALAARSAPGK